MINWPSRDHEQPMNGHNLLIIVISSGYKIYIQWVECNYEL